MNTARQRGTIIKTLFVEDFPAHYGQNLQQKDGMPIKMRRFPRVKAVAQLGQVVDFC